MPRKNARPAAKKEAARKKAKMKANAAPRRRVGIIAHHGDGTARLILAAMAAGLFKDQS